MNIKRYVWNACDDHGCHCDVVESADGDMVDYDDHVAVVAELEARCAALAAENMGLKAAASCLVSEYMMNKGTDSEFIACITPSKKTIGTGGAWDMWRHLDLTLNKTPATDAYQAEVRASARNDFIGRIEWIIRNECNPDKTEAIINELQNFSDELKLEESQ